MPTIITRGELPGKVLYRSTCSNCKTVFQYAFDETRAYDSRDQRDAGLRVIRCPLLGCGNEVFAGKADQVKKAYQVEQPRPVPSGYPHYKAACD